MADVISITVVLPEGAKVTLRGRAAWALEKLVSAGERGCTPIEHPGPRWSHYTYLIRKAGIVVETVTEGHGGAYAGHHAKYVLRTPLTVVEVVRSGEGRHAA